MLFLISDLEIALLICLGIALILGTIFFVASGTYKVKKDHEIVIEKIDTYYKTCKEGWHFFLPIKYRRVGYYCTARQERMVLIEGVKKIFITYEIEDVKKYHYSYIDLQTLINKIKRSYNEINQEILTDEFSKVGLKFISARS